MLKTVLVKNLKPNPFRRLDEYPIIREKVDALKESIDQTGFWGTICGREVESHIEIAFGHHRLVAIRESGIKQIEMIVRDLTNEQMLQMMARENMEEWGTSAWVEVETLRSTIEAYGKGLIQLPPVPRKTRGDVSHFAGTHTYTRGTVAEFLGWTRKHDGRLQPNFACETAFKAMEMIDAGLLNEADLKGLTRTQMNTLVVGQASIQRAAEKNAEREREDAERARDRAADMADERDRQRLEKQATVHRAQAESFERAAKERPVQFAREAAEKFRKGEGVRQVEQRAQEMRPTVFTDPKLHEIDDFARRLGAKLLRIAHGDDDLSGDVAFLKKNRQDLSDRAADELCQSFEALIYRLRRMQKTFQISTGSQDIETGSQHEHAAISND